MLLIAQGTAADGTQSSYSYIPQLTHCSAINTWRDQIKTKSKRKKYLPATSGLLTKK